MKRLKRHLISTAKGIALALLLSCAAFVLVPAGVLFLVMVGMFDPDTFDSVRDDIKNFVADIRGTV